MGLVASVFAALFGRLLGLLPGTPSRWPRRPLDGQRDAPLVARIELVGDDLAFVKVKGTPRVARPDPLALLEAFRLAGYH
jgi:hypothetical protein